MSLNKFMHPRNLYKGKKPNFKDLAVKYPDFRHHVKQDLSGKLVLDFKNPAALRVLSTVLLKEDFGLEVEIPANRLVPTIPLRLNYIHWIEDLIGHQPSSTNVNGIDIGTGASCIYPLLGHKLNGWKFLATEVDQESLRCAKDNVNSNGFHDHITVQNVGVEAGIRTVLEGTEQTYDFCMCNPPFFGSTEELNGTSQDCERQEPHAAPTASTVESITWGGEYRFISRLIQDSLVLRNRIRIYTSMVGKKQNLLALKEELKEQKVPVFSATEFCQGKTMRWGLAWSFDNSVSFPKSHFKTEKKKEKPPLALCIPIEVAVDFKTFCVYIEELLQQLKINCVETKRNNWILMMTLFVTENTWSHQRRKRRKQLRDQESGSCQAGEKGTRALSPPSSSTAPTTTAMETCEVTKVEVDGEDQDTTSNDTTPVELSDDTESLRVGKSPGEASTSFEESPPVANIKGGILLSSCKRHIADTVGSPDDHQPLTKKQKINCIEISEKEIASTESSPMELSSSFESQVDESSASLSVPKAVSCNGDEAEMESEEVAAMEVVPLPGGDSKGTKNNKKYLFQCNMCLKRKVTYIQMELAWVEGDNRELLHQMMQYFRNTLLT